MISSDRCGHLVSRAKERVASMCVAEVFVACWRGWKGVRLFVDVGAGVHKWQEIITCL